MTSRMWTIFRRACRAVAIAVVLCRYGLLWGQTAPPGPPSAGPSLHMEVLFRWRPDGMLEPFTVGTPTPSNLPTPTELLGEDVFVTALDLAEFQVDEIRKIESNYEKECKRIEREFRHGKNPGTLDQVIARLVATERRAGEAMRKVLLPAQQRRLAQMIYRCRLRRGGLRWEVTSQMSRAETDRSADIARLEKRARDLADDLSKKIMALRVQTIDELMAVLKPPQRDTVKEILGAAYYGSMPDVDVLRIQLAFQPAARAAAAERNPLEPLLANSTFDLAFDGQLVPRDGRRRRLVPTLIELLCQEPTQKSLQLSDAQRDAVNGLYGRLEALRNRQTEELTRAYRESRVARERPVAESLKALWDRERDRLHRQLDAELQDLLSPKQRRLLVGYATRFGWIRRGPLAMLLDSHLRKALAISKKQEEKLMHTAAGLRKRLVEQSAQLENRVSARLLEVLPPEERAKINAAMGKPIRGLPGALAVLRADLAGEIRHQIGFHGTPPGGP